MNQKTIDKLLSGRFILTLIGGLVFAYCAVKKQIEAAAISAILTSIFTSYFTRGDRSKENGDESHKKSENKDKTESPGVDTK